MRFKSVFVGITLAAVLCAVVFVTFGDILNFGDIRNDRCVAKIKGGCLSVKDYSAIYQDEVSYVESLVRQKLSKEDIQQSGIKEVALDKAIDDLVLAKFASEIGLKVGRSSVTDLVQSMPMFSGKDGNFDEQRFRDILSEAGMEETAYVERVRSSLAAVMLLECIFPRSNSGYARYYEAFAQDVLNGMSQSRVIDVIEVSPDAIKDVPVPTENILQDMYTEGFKNGELTMPEYRSARYILVTEDDALDEVFASDSEVESEIKNSELHDQRDVLNLVFSSESEADAAYQSLLEGKSFESVVKDAGTTIQAITLKNITKEVLPADARSAVFSLKNGEASKVFRSVVGWHIMKILNRHSISAKDLQELKKKVSLNIRRQKAGELFSGKVKKANEIISRGATSFDDIGGIFKKPLSGILKNFDISGLDSEGNRHTYAEESSIPGLVDALPVLAFSTQANTPSHFVNMGNAYFSVMVTDVVPSKVRNFEESKSFLSKKWKMDFVTAEMQKLAGELAAKLQAGAGLGSMDGVVIRSGESVVANPEKKSPTGYPDTLVSQVFDIKVGGVSSGVVDPKTGKVLVAMLKDVRSPKEIDEKELKVFRERFAGSGAFSIRRQLLSHLADKYHVKINHELLDSI
ncbi:MAG: SurA N-terminal domain-containing protein [Anaplasma sp.]